MGGVGCRNWIEVRQQAAEEDLQMPVVLEEFGAKIDKRCADPGSCMLLAYEEIRRPFLHGFSLLEDKNNSRLEGG